MGTRTELCVGKNQKEITTPAKINTDPSGNHIMCMVLIVPVLWGWCGCMVVRYRLCFFLSFFFYDYRINNE